MEKSVFELFWAEASGRPPEASGRDRQQKKLAPGQTNRLLAPSELSAFQEAINLTFMPSLLFLLLTLVSVFAIFSSSRKITLLAAAAMISGIVPLVVMGYQVAIPFVVLGAVALCASLIVHMIFTRAKALRG